MAAIPTEAEVRALVSQIVAGLQPSRIRHRRQRTTCTVRSTTARRRKPAIAIGADHGGYPLKERIGFRLKEAGHEVVDCGTDSADSVDYPDFAHAVAQTVARGAAGTASSSMAPGSARRWSPTRFPASGRPFATTSRAPATAGNTTTPTF